jgi:hypothetical protein
MARRRVSHEAELGDLGETLDFDSESYPPPSTSSGERISEKTHHYVIGKGWVPNDERNIYQKLFNIPGTGERKMARRGNRGGGLRAWQEAHGIDTSGWDHPKRRTKKKGKKSGRVTFITSSGQRVSFGAGKKRKGGKKRHVRKAARRGLALWQRMGYRKPGRKKGHRVTHRRKSHKAGRRGLALWQRMGYKKPGRKKGHRVTHRRTRKVGRKAMPMWKRLGHRKPGRKKGHTLRRHGRKHSRKSNFVVFKGKKYYA